MLKFQGLRTPAGFVFQLDRPPRWVRLAARFLPGAAWIALLLLVSGCGTAARKATFARPFVFGEDTFAYRNDLVWVYDRDPTTGKIQHRAREPKPDYTHHCFVVARAARQFFQHARFEPSEPVADEATYRKLVRKVATTSPRRLLPPDKRVVIPGYTNLYQFSRAHEKLLQAECGGAWQSYFQRGHWRMIFPFWRGHQQRIAGELAETLQRNRPAVLHVVRFPSLSINHAVLVYGKQASAAGEEVRFDAYDPYDPGQPAVLTFDPGQQRFFFPANDYFVGGRVDVYEVYHSWDY